MGFLGGAALLTAAVAVSKLLGALYKIPLGNLLGSRGMGISNFIIRCSIFLKTCSVMYESTNQQHCILTFPCIHFRQTFPSELFHILFVHNTVITSCLRVLP